MLRSLPAAIQAAIAAIAPTCAAADITLYGVWLGRSVYATLASRTRACPARPTPSRRAVYAASVAEAPEASALRPLTTAACAPIRSTPGSPAQTARGVTP